MNGCFVTGTDTSVGKTILSAAIVAALRVSGIAARGLKPVITGLDEPPPGDWPADHEPPGGDWPANHEPPGGDWPADHEPPGGDWPADHELLAAVTGCRPEDVILAGYGPPVSPHLAAELSGRPLTLEPLLTGIRAASVDGAALVVEGVGGLLVPLGEDTTVRDLARKLGLPLVVAARPGLGTINHTLLTLEAARAVGLQVAGVVLTPWPDRPGPIERSNLETLTRLGRTDVRTLPYIEGPGPGAGAHPPGAGADPPGAGAHARGTPPRPTAKRLASAARDLPLERWLKLDPPGRRPAKPGRHHPPRPRGARQPDKLAGKHTFWKL